MLECCGVEEIAGFDPGVEDAGVDDAFLDGVDDGCDGDDEFDGLVGGSVSPYNIDNYQN